MSLKSSKVHRNLDSKLKLLGFELYDLLAILLFAAVMNLIFGNTSLSFVFVFLLPGVLAVVLYIGKMNKPDGFLVHLIQYLLLPGIFTPGSTPRTEEQRRNYHVE